MRKRIIVLAHLAILPFLGGCAAVPHYEDAAYFRVSAGDKIKVKLIDGSRETLVVSEVDGTTITGEGGEVIAREDVDEISIRVEASDIPCSSLASWRNTKCWP